MDIEKHSIDRLTVLLVDGGDRQTLPIAQELKSLGYRVATLNASRLDNGYTTKFSDEKIVCKSISANKKEHLNAIENLVETGKYDVIITTSDDTAEGLSLMKERLEKYTKVAVTEPSVFYQAYDKYKTMQICMKNNIPCPKTYSNVLSFEQIPIKELKFPIVVKPRKSYGAIGYKKIDDKSSFKEFCMDLGDDLKEFVIQEYIPQTNIQYECAMFIDEQGEVKTSMVFSKNRWFPINGGSSTCNVSVKRQDIVEMCTKLLKEIGWRGAADIDLIQDPRDGTAKIIEINPRVSGSVKIVLKSGVNIVNQIMQLALGQDVSSYINYREGVRLRCIHTDLLWFIKSPNRFRTNPSWFSFKNTFDQIWSWSDPIPFWAFSVQSLKKYKKEIQKRKG